QYNAQYGLTSVQGTGNGLLYTLAPSLGSVALIGTVDRQYDGTTLAPVTQANFSGPSGLQAGDTAAIAFTSANANYDDKNVGTGKNVTVSGLSVTVTSNGMQVYGYQPANPSASAAIGSITPAPLTVTAQTDNRIYNGTTSSSAAPMVSG